MSKELRRTYVDSTFIFNQNSIESSIVKRSKSINIVLTLFFQRWNNVDKLTSAQLLFSSQHQRWNNVGSSVLNWHNSIDIISSLFGTAETTSMNIRRLNFHLQPNINVETMLNNVDDQRCFNVDVLTGNH